MVFTRTTGCFRQNLDGKNPLNLEPIMTLFLREPTLANLTLSNTKAKVKIPLHQLARLLSPPLLEEYLCYKHLWLYFLNITTSYFAT